MSATQQQVVHGSGEPAPLVVNAFDRFAEGVMFLCVDAGIVLLFCGLLIALFCVVRGPSLVDRGVATDLIAFLSVGLVILLTIRFERLVMFDAVIIVSILGFVGTVAIAQYVGRRGRAS